jgi:hypothetical protein
MTTRERLVRILVLALLLLLVTEIGPPIYRASVPEGLIATGEVYAHHPKPDPPKPGPGRDPNGMDVGSEARWWYVVRILRPTVPVYGPFLAPVPECQGYVLRFPTLYLCRRLP